MDRAFEADVAGTAAPGSVRRRLTFLGEQGVLLGAGFALLVAVAVASLLFVQAARRNSEDVAHTLDVQNQVYDLLLQIRRAESSLRGYLIAQSDDYLTTYRGAVGQIPSKFEELKALTADNPVQVAALARAEPLLDAKLEDMRHTLDFARSGDIAGATDIVKSGRGMRLMLDLGDVGNAILDEEHRLLATRSAAASSSITWLTVATLTGLALILALATVSVLLVRRQTVSLKATQRELETINAELERRVAERTADLTEANEEIQRFAYIVSHDLRAPLVNVMGFTSELEALKGDLFQHLEKVEREARLDGVSAAGADLSKDFDEAVGFIKASIGKMDRLIQAILRLSREGRREFRPESVDLARLVQSIAATLAHQLQSKDAEIEIGKLPTIVTDRLAVEQIFTNLLDNAVKYLRSGEAGRIKVTAVDHGRAVTILVKDNGRGIDPKDRKRVFELFRRSGAQDQPGEGIGLAHVRNFVRRLGGTIGLDSELGQGSTFKVTLPKHMSKPA